MLQNSRFKAEGFYFKIAFVSFVVRLCTGFTCKSVLQLHGLILTGSLPPQVSATGALQLCTLVYQTMLKPKDID